MFFFFIFEMFSLNGFFNLTKKRPNKSGGSKLTQVVTTYWSRTRRHARAYPKDEQKGKVKGLCHSHIKSFYT